MCTAPDVAHLHVKLLYGVIPKRQARIRNKDIHLLEPLRELLWQVHNGFHVGHIQLQRIDRYLQVFQGCKRLWEPSVGSILW